MKAVGGGRERGYCPYYGPVWNILEKEIENKRVGFKEEQLEAQKKLDDTIAENQKLQSETTDLRLKNSELRLEYYKNVDKLTDKQKEIEVAKKRLTSG